MRSDANRRNISGWGPASALIDSVYLQGANLVIVNQTDTLLDQVADVVVHEDVSIVLPAIKEALQKLKEVPYEQDHFTSGFIYIEMPKPYPDD